MNAAAHALETLVGASSPYDARLVGRDVALLEKLGLYVRIRNSSVATPGAAALFIGLFDASTDQRPGIGITCVGIGADPAAAANEATAQWCMGVLPVLANARGEHSCFAERVPFEVPAAGGPLEFTVVKGPIVQRGLDDGEQPNPPPEGGYLPLLAEALRACGLGDRLHWLECFATRTAAGNVDATCRLDNRDWAPGQQILLAHARGWPGVKSAIQTRRQFLLMLPRGEWPDPPAPRSFWARLFGANAG